MHEFEPRDGFVVAPAGEDEHEVGLVEVVAYPLACTLVAVDGMAEEPQPVVVVLHEPLLCLHVVLQEVGEGCQLGIAGAGKPLEELLASADGLLQGKQYAHIIL